MSSDDLGPYLHRTSDGLICFYCPGCKCGHGLNHRWTVNVHDGKPTITPSVVHDFKGEHPSRCHLWVVDGKLQFLTDCTHELSGKTVPMEIF